MDQPAYSDDEYIETTVNNHSTVSTNNSASISDSGSASSDDDAPAAAGVMILAEQSTYISSLSYTGNKILSIISWVGSGLYSLTTVFSNTVSHDEQHMHVLNTIAKLNNHLVFLDKKIEHMNLNSSRFSEQAKYLYKSKKIPSAIHQIRLKKMYDCEISKLEKLKFNIETNILHMDSVEIMMVTVDTIKDTSEHFKKINSSLNIEKLEDTIDELVEHRDSATDIQSVLSDMQLFNDANYDEEDLMKELQLLSANATLGDATLGDATMGDANATMGDANATICDANAPISTIRAEDLPEVPSTVLPYKISEQENNTLEMSGIF